MILDRIDIIEGFQKASRDLDESILGPNCFHFCLENGQLYYRNVGLPIWWSSINVVHSRPQYYCDGKRRDPFLYIRAINCEIQLINENEITIYVLESNDVKVLEGPIQISNYFFEKGKDYFVNFINSQDQLQNPALCIFAPLRGEIKRVINLSCPILDYCSRLLNLVQGSYVIWPLRERLERTPEITWTLITLFDRYFPSPSETTESKNRRTK